LSKGQDIQLIQSFCESLKKLDLNEAARIVEDVAKELLNMKAVTPSSLEKLANLVKEDISDEVDLARVRSEVVKLNIPYLSSCVAEALKNAGPRSKELTKLRMLIGALINFYKYYSGIEKREV